MIPLKKYAVRIYAPEPGAYVPVDLIDRVMNALDYAAAKRGIDPTCRILILQAWQDMLREARHFDEIRQIEYD